ncbi:MAG: hypothetical protein DMF42_10835 [Verrucomicrobia bacterium]|nr:MAG: hypothetical protein DMF42_10835 [Verrucomicrobiota bacterium]
MDETGRRLFQTDSDLPVSKTSAQRCHPGMKGFGATFNYTALDLGGATSLQADVDFSDLSKPMKAAKDWF